MANVTTKSREENTHAVSWQTRQISVYRNFVTMKQVYRRMHFAKTEYLQNKKIIQKTYYLRSKTSIWLLCLLNLPKTGHKRCLTITTGPQPLSRPSRMPVTHLFPVSLSEFGEFPEPTEVCTKLIQYGSV